MHAMYVAQSNTLPHVDVVSPIIAWLTRVIASAPLNNINAHRWNATCSAEVHQRRSWLAHEPNDRDAAEAWVDSHVYGAPPPICSRGVHAHCGRAGRRVRVLVDGDDQSDRCRRGEMSVVADLAANCRRGRWLGIVLRDDAARVCVDGVDLSQLDHRVVPGVRKLGRAACRAS